MFRKIALVAAAAAMLMGCSTLGLGGDTKKAAVAAMTTYTDVIQPSIIAYKTLPDCGETAPTLCKQPAVVLQLQATDRVVMQAMEAANDVLDDTVPDTEKLAAVIQAVKQAQAQFAAAGLTAAK